MIAFRRVITVVLENASRDIVLTNPYMRDLRRKGVFLSNSHCVTHPSQPNYFTMIAGDTMGVVNDNDGWVYWPQETQLKDGSYPDVTSIVDRLEAKGLSWKAYAEDFAGSTVYPANATLEPGTASMPDNSVALDLQPPLQYNPTGLYNTKEGQHFARRHVPFLSFPNIVNRSERLSKIVDGSEFDVDLQHGTLPHYSFYTPNLIHDGHDGPDSLKYDPINDSAQLDNIQCFLQCFLGEDPIKKFPPETLIIITFDESYGADAHYNIYTLLIGDMLEAGTVCHEPYNHYSMLRTIEDNFGLGTLGRNDSAAMPYWFVRRNML